MIQIVVQFDPQTRQVQVSGPLQDKVLCYGLLEIARDTLHEHFMRSEAAKIVPVPAGALPGPPVGS